MKRINFYIFEKLKLNNSTEVEEKEYKFLTDKYDKGDKCLLLINNGLRHQEKITVEAVKITRKTKTILEFEYLTRFNTRENTPHGNITVNRNDNERLEYFDYAFFSGTSATRMLIPPQDCKEIIELIEKNNYKLDFYDTLHGHGYHKEKDLLNIKQLKESSKKNWEFTFEDYEDITKDTFDKIKSIILN